MIKIRFLGAAFAGCMGIFSLGTYIGWASPTIPQLLKDDCPIKLTEVEASLVVSLLKVGTALGCIFAIFLVDFIGRKGTIIFSTIPSMIGWIIILFAKTPTELYVARIVGGISNGLSETTVPMYLAEISPASIRGTVEFCSIIVMYIAIIFSYGIGPFIDVRQFSEIAIAISLLHGFLFIWFPETPYYFIKRKNSDAARTALEFLRSDSEITEEFESIKRTTFMGTERDWKFREVFTFSKDTKILILGVGVMLITVTSGEMLLVHNAEWIFNSIEGKVMDGKYLSMILAGLQISICIIFSLLVDRIGRKLLLLISCTGVVISSFFVGCYFYIQNIGYHIFYLSWLPTIGLLLIVSTSVGATAIPCVIVSEIFSMKMKSIYTGICMFITSVCAFAALEIFSLIVNYVNIYTAFWALASVNVWNVAFVYIFLSETKLKTLEEIQLFTITQGQNRKSYNC